VLGIFIAALVVVAIVLVATNAISTSSAVRATGQVVTQKEAEQVLRQVWRERELARANDDVGALEAIDTGAELDRDVGDTLGARDRGVASHRVARPLGPTTSVELTIPPPSKLPPYFLAAVQTTAPWRQWPSERAHERQTTVLLVLTKASTHAPWRVAMETGGVGSLQELYEELEELDQEGRHPGGARAQSATKSSSLITALASYYQYYAEWGHAPSHSSFQQGQWTTEQGRSIANAGLRYEVNSGGFRNEVNYSVDAATDDVYRFEPAPGATLICGTVRGREVATPPEAGTYLVQPVSRAIWGGWLAPGAYSTVERSIIHQVCITVSPTRGGAAYVISGEEEGESAWNATGMPAQPPAPTGASEGA
jgi:hypothetical protein